MSPARPRRHANRAAISPRAIPEMGERLRKRRTDLGLSTADLAWLSDSDRSLIIQAENGTYRGGMSMPTFVRIAKVLHCSADWLLCLSDDPVPREADREAWHELTVRAFTLSRTLRKHRLARKKDEASAARSRLVKLMRSSKWSTS